MLQIKYASAESEKGGTVVKDGYTAVQLGSTDKKRKSATRVDAINVVGEVEDEVHGSSSCQTKWDGSQLSPNAGRCPIASRVRLVVQ